MYLFYKPSSDLKTKPKTALPIESIHCLLGPVYWIGFGTALVWGMFTPGSLITRKAEQML